MISYHTLLALVKRGFDSLKLTINVDKSQVISPVDDTWEVVNEAGLVVLTLDQVEQVLGHLDFLFHVQNSIGETANECEDRLQVQELVHPCV